MSSKNKQKSTHKQNKDKPSKKRNDEKSNKHKPKTKKRRKTKSEKKIIRKEHKNHIKELKKAFQAKQQKSKHKKKHKSKSFKKKLSLSIKKKEKKHKSKSMKIKNKNKTKNKPKKVKKPQPDETKNDRLNIQRQKDIEMAKKRLSKKLNTLEIPRRKKKNNKKSVRIQNMFTDDDIWNEYMFKFGTGPQNVSHLQNFSKSSAKCQTLTYKKATSIFNKFSQKEEKMDENKQNYIERDMQTAKKRLSQRISTKQSNILLKVIESQLADIDETESVYCFVDDDNDGKNEQKRNKRKKSAILRKTMVEIETFIESERAFVFEALSVGLDTFYERLRVHNQINKSIIGETDIVKIFGNYRTIYNVNSKLYADLKELPLNRGVNELIYSLGNKMVDFIPYFKIYIEYIVKKQAAISHLEHLKKTNKAFQEFLKINELCVKTKLKSLLEEPAHRIPQYLQYLVNIYTSYKHERMKNSESEQLLLQCIGDIKKVSDQIAIKCRDLRSRLLVGTLQRDLFGNKIKLLSAHRFCIAYSSMDMLLSNNNKIKEYKFILLNDIFLISTFPSKFKSAQVMAVYPLIGVRISRYMNQSSLASTGYKLNLLPSNIIIMFDAKQKMEKWVTIIQNAVDKQEHSMKQCNVVDLEKRVRNQKTSKEGESETINITNPARIKAIEKWKKQQISPFASIPTLKKQSKPKTATRKARSKTFGGIKKKEKNLLKRLASLNKGTSADTDSSQPDKKGKVRVMRDEEVLQFDEEIPMENFMKALNSGFVKITNEEEQMEQYKKAAATAKNLVDSSLQVYRASVFSDDWDSSDSDEYWD